MKGKAKELKVTYTEAHTTDEQWYRVVVEVSGETEAYSVEGPSKAIVMSKVARLLVWLV